MKKLSLVAFSLCFIVLSASAQKKIQFGFKGGVNLTSAYDENLVPDEKVSAVLAYHFGGLAHIHLASKWAVQPEVVYSKEGGRVEHPSYNATTETKYINVPVLAQYFAGGGLRIQTGPQLGFLVDHKADKNGVETTKDDVKSTNFSWAFGLGYKTNSGFGIDGRFNLGLTNLYKDGTHPGAVTKSRVWQLGVFYQF
jgi:hypothetical protein